MFPLLEEAFTLKLLKTQENYLLSFTLFLIGIFLNPSGFSNAKFLSLNKISLLRKIFNS